MPQRSHGKTRVEAILAAAADVIAEQGYDNATMAEIAARAESPIGSLYRFFPNKEILAKALVDRYAVLINEAFDVIDLTAASVPLEVLSDTFLNFMVNLHEKTKGLVPVLEANEEWARQLKFREIFHRRLVRALLLRVPDLPTGEAKNIAAVLMHNIKAMRSVAFSQGISSGPKVAAELTLMNRLYLINKLNPTGK